MNRTRLGSPRQLFWPGIPDLLRDAGSAISGYLSLSWSAPYRFGGRPGDFTAETRALLTARS